jgi:hypothetical protein
MRLLVGPVLTDNDKIQEKFQVADTLQKNLDLHIEAIKNLAVKKLGITREELKVEVTKLKNP